MSRLFTCQVGQLLHGIPSVESRPLLKPADRISGCRNARTKLSPFHNVNSSVSSLLLDLPPECDAPRCGEFSRGTFQLGNSITPEALEHSIGVLAGTVVELREYETRRAKIVGKCTDTHGIIYLPSCA